MAASPGQVWGLHPGAQLAAGSPGSGCPTAVKWHCSQWRRRAANALRAVLMEVDFAPYKYLSPSCPSLWVVESPFHTPPRHQFLTSPLITRCLLSIQCL